MYAACLDTLAMNSAQHCLCSEILTEPHQRAPGRRSHYFKALGSKGPVAIEGSSWGHFLKALSALTGDRQRGILNISAPGAKGKRENCSLWVGANWEGGSFGDDI